MGWIDVNTTGTTETINTPKPSHYLMTAHNIQRLRFYVLVWISEQKAIISMYSIN